MHNLEMAAEFLAESLAPFEMTHRGFREANNELRQLNKTLENEISERKLAEAGLQRTRDELELRVQLRTAELAQANADLQTEISERKRYEEELLLRDRAIEASSAGIIITDARQKDNPIIYVNPAFAHMTGYSREELIGLNPRILQGPETDPEDIERIRQDLRETQSCLITLKNHRKDGTAFWNELFISPSVIAGTTSPISLAFRPMGPNCAGRKKNAMNWKSPNRSSFPCCPGRRCRLRVSSSRASVYRQVMSAEIISIIFAGRMKSASSSPTSRDIRWERRLSWLKRAVR